MSKQTRRKIRATYFKNLEILEKQKAIIYILTNELKPHCIKTHILYNKSSDST